MKLAYMTPASCIAIAFIGISAVQAQTVDVSTLVTRAPASDYPIVQTVQALVPVQRSCTQLEMNSGIEPAQCGHLSLSDVAAAYFAQSDDD
ncbi:hypothetical protein [Jannaschia sp. CCS1]|uniref:hypothetical protein n=1 Tax=Jannaschia sp. (strain CCS1) TaxID=290400 RepID=UPI000053A9A1|nr:hypothetical protein [Jannaschia sp. CCS1]ABD55174.1 hypothetical protein Jann_2257 [Jannaschia sp. CCS1]